MAVQGNRELVQPGHEHVDAVAGAVVEGVGDVGVGGEVGGFQAGGVGGGEDGESGSTWVAWTRTARGAACSCSMKNTFSAYVRLSQTVTGALKGAPRAGVNEGEGLWFGRIRPGSVAL